MSTFSPHLDAPEADLDIFANVPSGTASACKMLCQTYHSELLEAKKHLKECRKHGLDTEAARSEIDLIHTKYQSAIYGDAHFSKLLNKILVD